MPVAFTSLHAATLVSVGLLNIGLAVLVLRTRSDQDVRPLGGFLVGISLWTIPQGFLLVETDPAVGLALSVVINSGAVIMATGLFHFALAYTGRTEWLRPGRLGAIYLGTCLWIVVIWTDPIHNWMHQPMEYTEVLLPVVEYQKTGYWLYVFWNWSLSAGGIFLFFLEYVDARGSGVYHRQSRLVVLAPLIPGAANVLAFFEVTSVNYSVWGFGATGILIAIALYRYRWLDLVPIARDRVIDEMRDGYLVIDDDRRVVDYNAAARSIVDEDVVVGEPIRTALPEAGPLLDGERTELTIARGATVVDATVSSVGDERTEGAVLMLRDVTEQRRAERRFQALIENVSDVVVVVTADSEITYASPSVQSVLGYRPADVVGTSVFDFVHGEDRERAINAFDELRTGPDDETRFEYRGRHRDGSWVGLEGGSVDLLDNDLVDGVVISIRDVTERNERERELERTNQRLDEFVGVISHDLQNPLGLAKNYTRLATQSGNPDDVGMVADVLDRMERMIQRFLTMARAGTTITETEPVDLATVAADSWVATATQGSTLECELPADWTVDGDYYRLRHVFENLFRNAVVHNDRPVTVRVGALDLEGSETQNPGEFADHDDRNTTGDPVGVFVEDDGVGIPESIRPFVFERGHTTSDDGAGFGLAIVRDVVEAHGWSIEVRNGPDGGARFEIVTT
ncbi:PAS domain S-box protein [Natronorubrum sp. JWXQ-INN-674]|uniref:histidine kinase n=1 Tax=Natronorubrum halalkaliphilum TaxID=2691917 RepID=A0A6B0VMX9_9EURY|nr:histidine kinase N-terminal 7TM domain-containing protein [Natronorubrum halalkaliphilum]MXV61909.1 PAS domain S-box protein [Natronorubrum halalkaliphilum]